MTVETTKNQLLEHRALAILRGDYRGTALALAQALYDGGIRLLEITTNSEDAFGIMAQLAQHFGDRLLIGGGTVLTVEHVQQVRDAGGHFVVSPDTYPAVIEAALAQQLVPLPGALTPSEMTTAMRAGADFVKLFPASQMGPGYIKQVTAPLDQIKIFPTGGLDAHNARAYLDAGAAGIGFGSALAPKTFAGSDDEIETITARARQIVAAMK